jgi:hypothetical protein
MNDQAAADAEDIEDIGAAIREGRPISGASSYRIAVSDESLTFRPVIISDPIPAGCQILKAAGFEKVEEYSLFAILPNGDFEDVRLDEAFDLRQRGADRFVAFRTDRDFRLTLNDEQLQWGKPVINGSALYILAKVPEDQAVFLKVREGKDRLVEPGDLIDLTAPGVEQFVTAPRPTPTYEIIVNSRPRFVTGREVTFDQIVQLAFPGTHEPNVDFSMTYRHAVSKPPSGELGPGGTVQVKNGTIFNVTRTIQS